MHRSQRHDGDGHGGAAHIDCCAQRNRDGVDLFVQTQPFAQRHIDGDVRSGAAGKERGDAALLQALEYQRVRILADGDERHDRIDDQRRDQHAAHKHEQELAVIGENVQTTGGHGVKHQTQNAKGREVDHPAHRCSHGVGRVGKGGLGGLRSAAQGNTENDSPEENAEIIAVCKRVYGIIHNVGQQRFEHIADAAGRGAVRSGSELLQCDREECAGQNRNDGCEEGGDQVQCDNGGELSAQPLSRLCQRAGDQHEYQNWRNRFQRADKQRAEHGNPCGRWYHQRQHQTGHQPDHDAQHQTGAVVFADDFFQKKLILSVFLVNSHENGMQGSV